MRQSMKTLFLGVFLLLVIALATLVRSSSNRKHQLLEQWYQEGLSSNTSSYDLLSKHIDPNNTSDPILVSTVGSIVFNNETSYDEKVAALQLASFSDPFVNGLIHSTNMSNSTIVNTIQQYLLTLKINKNH